MHNAGPAGPRFRLVLLSSCLGLALGAGPQAYASSALEILGAPSGGNQLTARVLNRSSATTYFNPALLPEVQPKLEVGTFGLASQARVRLKARPAGVDVPDLGNTQLPDPPPGSNRDLTRYEPISTQNLPHLRSDTDDDENVVYASIGMVRPLAGKSLVFGLFALLPLRSFMDQRGHFADEREQFFTNKLHFELLGDRLDTSSIAFAGGSQLADWVSIGFGIDVSIYTQTTMTVYMPNAAEQSTILLEQNVHTDSRFNPYGGLVIHPNPRSTLTATVHLPWNNVTSGSNTLTFWDTSAGQKLQTYTFTQGYEPLRVSLGGSFQGRLRDDGRAPWEIGVQFVGERWSQYRNRLQTWRYDDTGVLQHLDEYPLDRWKDTVTCAIGGGFLWRERHVTADIAYVPSPVPDQTGRTNYVDNSRLLASLGIEGPVRFLGRELDAGVSVFGAYFLPRETTKDPAAAHPVVDEYTEDYIDIHTRQPVTDSAGLQTNNPGYPGWKSSGYMLGAGVTLRIAR
jgi:long-chain fatty acid transport protein